MTRKNDALISDQSGPQRVPLDALPEGFGGLLNRFFLVIPFFDKKGGQNAKKENHRRR